MSTTIIALSTKYAEAGFKIQADEVTSRVNQAKELMSSKKLNKEELEFVSDTLDTLFKMYNEIKVKFYYNEDEIEEEILRPELKHEPSAPLYGNMLDDSPMRRQSTPMMHQTTIKLNQLVITPEKFDGRKPHPRKWLDTYNYAIEANDWTEYIAVKYFATFLSGPTQSWFKMEVRPMFTPNTKWRVLEDLFKTKYLGASERSRLMELLKTTQRGTSEPISAFIPRMKELLLQLDPAMSESEQVRNIQDKVRNEFKQWISFFEPQTVDQIKKCCMKVEINIDYNKLHKKKENLPKTKKVDSSNKGKKCYRCGRANHVSPGCKAKWHVDGTIIKDKTPTRTDKKQVNKTANKVCNCTIDHDEDVVVVSRVNAVKLIDNKSDKAIRHKISCNGIEYIALIDTGSAATILSEDAADKLKIKIEPRSESLVGAGGEPLGCLGTATVKLEIVIGKIKKAINLKVVIAKKIKEPMLVDLIVLIDLISLFVAHIDNFHSLQTRLNRKTSL